MIFELDAEQSAWRDEVFPNAGFRVFRGTAARAYQLSSVEAAATDGMDEPAVSSLTLGSGPGA